MSNIKTTSGLLQMGPIQQLRAGKLYRRLAQLFIGLSFFGLSVAMMIRGNLGLSPWDALHVGLSNQLNISFGIVFICVSFIVLLIWVPLREIPGIGTIANAIVIGVVADISLRFMAQPDLLVSRLALTMGGIVLCGFGSALYIGAQFGRGPRDGLMTGFSRVTGFSLAVVRTTLEITVLLLGVLLAGLWVVGIGTILFALLIGPLTQLMLPWVLIKVGSDGQSVS